MNKYVQFVIVVEVKESYNDLKNFKDYNLIKEDSHMLYENTIILKQLRKYVETQNECRATFYKKKYNMRNDFIYSDGTLIKFLVNEKNKTLTKFIIYEGVVNKEYADINRKFAIEEFHSKNGQDSYMRINNYIEFYMNTEEWPIIVNNFLEDIVEINNPHKILYNEEFINIKIQSPQVKTILKDRDDLEIKIDLYSKVSLHIDEEIKDNKIKNLKINVINIGSATTNS